MHRSKQLAAVLAAGVAAVGIAACGSDDDGGSAGGGTGGGSSATKPSDVTVGVVLKTFANDYRRHDPFRQNSGA